MVSEDKILFIEPVKQASTLPVIDALTRQMTAAWRSATTSDYVAAGVHRCVCGAHSDNVEHFLPNGTMTNSLCVHYLAHHRQEIPASELDKVRTLACGEAEPNESELQSPTTEKPANGYKIFSEKLRQYEKK